MLFRQSLLICLSIILAILLKSIFSNLISPIFGVLIIVYVFFSNRKNAGHFNLFILITLTLLLVRSTGDISSPFFFLLYFLSFTIAFVFDPRIVFIFTVGLIVFFFSSALKTDLTRNLIILFSFVLLSPLAFFFGTQYQQNLTIKKKVESMRKKAQIIENDVEDILYDDEELDPKAASRLNKVLEEAEEVEEE